MRRQFAGCKASGRRRLWDESENTANGTFTAYPPGAESFAQPLGRGLLGVSPDTLPSPLLDANQNRHSRTPCYYPDRHPSFYAGELAVAI